MLWLGCQQNLSSEGICNIMISKTEKNIEKEEPPHTSMKTGVFVSNMILGVNLV
tara:strand:- start:412 stop:573 length:162 start_codon:yes stop_codon:yes gene_type:complete